MTPPSSPPGSLAGWSLRIWLAKNKGMVKGVAAVACGYLTSLVGAVPDPQLNLLLSGAVGLATKLGLDVLDYWLSEVPPS